MLTHVLGGGDPLHPLHPDTCVSMENLIILGAWEKTESVYLLCCLMCVCVCVMSRSNMSYVQAMCCARRLVSTCGLLKRKSLDDICLCVCVIAGPMVYDVRLCLIR